MDGWTDGRTDGRMYICMYSLLMKLCYVNCKVKMRNDRVLVNGGERRSSHGYVRDWSDCKIPDSKVVSPTLAFSVHAE
jgi:hypothetical protein